MQDSNPHTYGFAIRFLANSDIPTQLEENVGTDPNPVARATNFPS